MARVEELTRIPSDVQDALITILSEKSLPIPELGDEVQATKGFNVIATANNRDRGVNELSSALKRRFNTVILPVPSRADEEVEIVRQRVEQLGRALELPAEPPALDEIRRIVTIFRELRSGQTEDGKAYEIVFVRQIVERTRVDGLNRISHDEDGKALLIPAKVVVAGGRRSTY